MNIREYKNEDEKNWVRCRVLSFLDTAYYDSVFNEKEKYENPSIELIAEQDNIITGILDIELDSSERKVCKKDSVPSGMIWHVCVHPDYRRTGIAGRLLKHAEKICLEKNITRVEAWTRDDKWVREWYLRMGFTIGYSYLHVNLNYEELKKTVQSNVKGMVPINMFAHYDSNDKAVIKQSFKRVNECVMFEKNL